MPPPPPDEPLPPPIDIALRHHRSGRLDQAAAIYREILKRDPHDADALHLLGLLLHQTGDNEQAAELIGRATESRPDDPQYHYHHGIVLARLGRAGAAEQANRRAIALRPDYTDAYLNLGIALKAQSRAEAAADAYRAAIGLDPRNHQAHFNLANVLLEQGQYPQAIESYRRTIALEPRFDAAHNNLGNALKDLGRLEEAGAEYRAALAVNPDFGEAERNLTACRRYAAADDADARRIEARLRRTDVAPGQRIPLHFALGKIYDDCGNYAAAFAQYHAGNQLKRSSVRFDETSVARGVERIMRRFTRDFLLSRAERGSPSERPLFIVGMPRSGTTLVEQVIASHPLAHGAGELSEIFRIVDGIAAVSHSAQPYPEGVADPGAQTIARLATQYEQRLARGAPRSAVRITDKNPLNFRHLGLIALLFPRARIIHCTRDRLDTALSIYFQYFVHGHEYAYDLDDIAGFYRQYERLMQHWHEHLTVPIHTLRYEELVGCTAKTARELLAFAGLPWDERCLSFQHAGSAVRTASAWQVRQPLYTHAVGRWRNYARQLAPLRQALGETGG